jgi:outer membrane protein TolC
VDIIDLLDAQNAALNAGLAAANAVYDFLIDLVEVERSVGKLYFLATETERSAMGSRLREYFQKAGVQLPGAR